MTAADYIQAVRARGRFCRAIRTIMADLDILALPTTAQPAERFEQAPAPPGRPSLTRIFNITGQPSISVPCGFTTDGLPIGLMLSGRPFEDATVLRLAHAHERAHDWHARRPPALAGR